MKSDELLNKLYALRDEIKQLRFDDQPQVFKLKKQFELYVRIMEGNDSHYLDEIAGINFIDCPGIGESPVDVMYRHSCWETGKEKLVNLLDVFVQEISLLTPETEKSQSSVSPKKESLSSNKVFIVHGHDNEMLQSVARFVEKMGLIPIILHEQANEGRTIIEKFEDYSDVPFAIVLFSPDDLGKAKSDSSLRPRPRQNVVFELGFFIGKLGRKNAVVLNNVVQDFEMLSDFQGVLYYSYQDGWELSIAREMKSAGMNVDLNKLA